MARTISTKLAVEGEAQYKQAIAACNSELSTLKSGLALVESEFRGNANSMEALTAKGAALDSMYKKQQEKVSTLEAALRNAQRAQEEYSSRVSTAQSNIERCERALETLRRSTGDTSREQEALTKELDKWNAELEEAQAGQAAAGFTEASTAVDVLTTAINSYKLEGTEAERVASMLVKTQDEGKTSVGELAANMGRVIPSAAAYNVSLENLTTAYAILQPWMQPWMERMKNSLYNRRQRGYNGWHSDGRL